MYRCTHAPPPIHTHLHTAHTHAAVCEESPGGPSSCQITCDQARTHGCSCAFRATTRPDCDRVDLDTLHLWIQPLRAVGGSHPSGQDGQPSLLRVTHSQGPDASVLCRPVTCATCATCGGATPCDGRRWGLTLSTAWRRHRLGKNAGRHKESSQAGGFHHPELNEAGDPTKPLHKPGDPPEGGRFPHFGKVWRSKAYFRKVWRSNPLLPK